jgi:hypothetical protein
MEAKYARLKSNVNETQLNEVNTDDEDANKYIDLLQDVTSSITIKDIKQCHGFCQVPKYMLYSKTIQTSSALESCSKYMIGYLVDFVSTFRNYCMWHCQICLFQLILCCILFFKMPSLSRMKEFHKLKEEEERVAKIHRDALDFND